MKRTSILFVLLISFGLCSCSNTWHAVTSTEQLTNADAGLDEINTETPSETAPVSITFMGELITAPGHYPGVPDAYIPVLDDLYLCGELSLRYGNLYDEGKIPSEIMNEKENLEDEIWARGYLPSPCRNLGVRGGYALLDLDNDGSSELLILKNSSYDSSMPVIQSIFAIRDGQLVCIDNGSTKFEYTTLAADGTFYECIDWPAGYADLIAFCLDAGRSEFTTISEAHAALSFSDSDVPSPYWTKTENGNKSEITEEEFNLLLEQFKSPQKELIVLNFVSLHPNAISLKSIPRTADDPPAIPIDCPIAYQGTPEAYKPILDGLFLLEKYRGSEEFNSGVDFLKIVHFTEYPHNTLGYALADLNGDGVLELFLGTIDGLNDSAPHSIFTLHNGQPVFLQSFWYRHHGVISADGTIYIVGSGGAAYTCLYSFQLNENSDALTQLTDLFSDYSHAEETPYFVQVIEGRNHYITEEEFFNYRDIYNNPPERMELTFIPIA